MPEMTPARALHERVLTLDTHLDTPALLVREGWDITQRHEWSSDFSQVDLPRMIEGGLDGGFWVVYTPQGPRTPEGVRAARDFALRRATAIREMVAAHPQHFGLALRADDAATIVASGRRVVFLSMENGYPVSDDVTLLSAFYRLGLRMAGPVHFSNNDLADSSTDPRGADWDGLSPAGEAFVREANRLGIVLDASHASDAAFDDMLALSATPIILSHSGVDAVYDHPRNIDDERLRRLAAAGGVIQMNSLGGYLTALPPSPPERRSRMREIMGAAFGLTDRIAAADVARMNAAREALDHEHPPSLATFEDFMAHLLHALEVVGPEHVGIGADFDGGGGVVGMEDVAGFPQITERLLAAGYSEEDIANIWGGNVLRVLRAAEAYAETQAATPAP